MHLRVKPLQKVVRLGSEVNKVFEAQGFKKKGIETPYYYLRLTDNCTLSTYNVRIPVQEIYFTHVNKEEPYYKMNKVQIEAATSTLKDAEVPKAIVEAVNEKICEAVSYLQAHTSKI